MGDDDSAGWLSINSESASPWAARVLRETPDSSSESDAPPGRGPRRCTCARSRRASVGPPLPTSLSMAAVRRRLKGPPGSASVAAVAHHLPGARGLRRILSFILYAR